MNPLWMILPAALSAPVIQPAAKQPGVELEAAISRLEKAYRGRNLGELTNPGRHAFKVTIEHALIEPPAGIQSRTFTSFADLEMWLKSREHGDQTPGEELLPSREARPHVLVRPGLIEYANQGIRHNTLYLSRIRFAQKGQAITILEMAFYDGD